MPPSITHDMVIAYLVFNAMTDGKEASIRKISTWKKEIMVSRTPE